MKREDYEKARLIMEQIKEVSSNLKEIRDNFTISWGGRTQVPKELTIECQHLVLDEYVDRLAALSERLERI